jgi:hypothetical protein
MMKLQWHPSLKKTFKGCEVWWQSSMVARNKREAETALLTQSLSQEGRFRIDPSSLMILAQTYCIEACLAGQKGEANAVATALNHGVAFRSLDFLKIATRTYTSDKGTLLNSLWTSMMAVGPTMLSDWEHGALSAYYLIQLAHKDMRINHPLIRKEGWGKGTNDAFLVSLLSQAYGIPTHYESVNPMVKPYRQLLDVWQTTDEGIFQTAMNDAAEYHITRSKDGTDRNKYEFEEDIDRVYPGELLAVQALRRRDGLPEFTTGHLLIDTPWSIIRDLPECEPHPLAVRLEERLRSEDANLWELPALRIAEEQKIASF